MAEMMKTTWMMVCHITPVSVKLVTRAPVLPKFGSPDGLRILSVWRQDRLIGALPLYEAARGSRPLGPRRLRFLSTGEAEMVGNDLCIRQATAGPLDATVTQRQMRDVRLELLGSQFQELLAQIPRGSLQGKAH